MKPYRIIAALIGATSLLVGCTAAPADGGPSPAEAGNSAPATAGASGNTAGGWVQVQGKYTPFKLSLPADNSYQDYSNQGPSQQPSSADVAGPIDVWAHPTMTQKEGPCTLQAPCYNVGIGTSNAKNFADAVQAQKSRETGSAPEFTISHPDVSLSGASNTYASLSCKNFNAGADWDFVTVIAGVGGTTYVLTLMYMATLATASPTPAATGTDTGADALAFFAHMAPSVQPI